MKISHFIVITTLALLPLSCKKDTCHYTQAGASVVKSCEEVNSVTKCNSSALSLFKADCTAKNGTMKTK